MSFIAFLKYLVTSNFVNFLIMIALLYYLVKKFNLAAIFENGILKIKEEISNSEDAKNEANNMLEKANLQLKDLPEKIKLIKADNELKKQTMINNINLSAEKSVEMYNSNTEKMLEFEEKKISSELLMNTLNSVVKKAEADIFSKLENSPELHYQLIDEALKDLEGVEICK